MSGWRALSCSSPCRRSAPALGRARRGRRRSAWFTTDQGRVAARRGAADPGDAASSRARPGIRAGAALEDLLALAGRCRLSAAARLDGLAQSRRRATSPGRRRERFSVLGLETVGYEGEVVLPIHGAICAAGRSRSICTAPLDYLTCSEICVPYQTDARARPAGRVGAGGGGFGALIARSRRRCRATARRPGFALDRRRVAPGRASRRSTSPCTATIRSPRPTPSSKAPTRRASARRCRSPTRAGRHDAAPAGLWRAPARDARRPAR